MKLIEERNFPYPILLENGGDYNESFFRVQCSTNISSDKKYLELKFSYEIKNAFIEKLLEEGKASLQIKVTQRTFRNIGKLKRENIMRIPLEWLSPNYNVEIIPMIIAKKDFSFSYDESMDRSFSFFDDDFIVKRYQILGYGNLLSIELPTSSKVGSIFTISKIKDSSEIAKGVPFIIAFENDTIDIKVLPNIYDSFYESLQMNASFNKILYSTFVYPAIQLAIITIMQDYESVKDLKWCIAIVNKIGKEKSIHLSSVESFSVDDIIEYTHIVLDTLLQDAFNDIRNGGDTE
ncbi:MAG: hypothetical protein K2K48_03440 [Anaeroplasmataceae bacterium]|nr:hypothetical protein [Anaeroplasmataceae bacterium]MDE6414446.1 hypothetical protein [Anaeroplasmataceae bacterium]